MVLLLKGKRKTKKVYFIYNSLNSGYVWCMVINNVRVALVLNGFKGRTLFIIRPCSFFAKGILLNKIYTCDEMSASLATSKRLDRRSMVWEKYILINALANFIIYSGLYANRVLAIFRTRPHKQVFKKAFYFQHLYWRSQHQVNDLPKKSTLQKKMPYVYAKSRNSCALSTRWQKMQGKNEKVAITWWEKWNISRIKCF